MTTEQTQKLLDLYNAGCIVRVTMGYVDGDAVIYIANEAVLVENNGFHVGLELGDVCFDSEVYAQFPLKQVPSCEVLVSKPIENWQEIDISELIDN